MRAVDDIYDYRIPWNPSEQRFQQYLEREVQLARINVVAKNNNPTDTLHSKATVSKVLQKA